MLSGTLPQSCSIDFIPLSLVMTCTLEGRLGRSDKVQDGPDTFLLLLCSLSDSAVTMLGQVHARHADAHVIELERRSVYFCIKVTRAFCDSCTLKPVVSEY